jgi:C4-dicarboxylate-specific signal transduction histidine kinase
MSNLSPDDSAKTMMTNVSRMVETLGSVVNTLAKESATTNDTIKQMMIQQTATMNNLMMLMAGNEERRQEIPLREIQQTSTPTSTITNSQFSLSQHSTNANKRKLNGIADDDTTAISTVANEP